MYIHVQSKHCHISLVEHYHVSSYSYEKVNSLYLNKICKFNEQANTNNTLPCQVSYRVLLCSFAFFWKRTLSMKTNGDCSQKSSFQSIYWLIDCRARRTDRYVKHAQQINRHTLSEKCPYLELFWSTFFRIQTEYGEIRSISPYSVRMRVKCGPE